MAGRRNTRIDTKLRDETFITPERPTREEGNNKKKVTKTMTGMKNYSTKSKDETFTTTSSERSTVLENNDKLTGDGDNEAPAVFLCGKCRLPVGDSLSWAGSEDDLNQILLRRINDNVVIGKEPFVSGTRKELGCLVVNLSCQDCSSVLGMMYMSTPKKLDYKRALFCLNIENIESYVLGSDQQMAEVDTEEKPVTMEYQESVEKQMTEMKELALTMGQRLLEIEVDLQNNSQ